MKNLNLNREFNDKNFGEMVDLLNTFSENITLGDNMSGQVIENITLPLNGDEVGISHNLKITPKYRIILRQSGQGIVIDGIKEWNDKTVYLKRDTLTAPAEDLTISILLMRG